jgi:uncharacterized protein
MGDSSRDEMLAVVRAIWAAAPEMTPGSVDAMLSYCAEDMVMEWPFGPPKTCHSKAEARAFLVASLVAFDEFVNEGLYCDEGKQTVIATGYSSGRNPRTDKPYANRYVLVFHFRDGLIDVWQEYLNPIAVLAAFGDPAS